MRYHFYTFIDHDDNEEIVKFNSFLESLSTEEYKVNIFSSVHKYYCFETNNAELAVLFRLIFE